MINVDEGHLFDQIERAHRGGPVFSDGTQLLFIKFYNSDDVNKYNTMFRRACVANKQLKIRTENQYSKKVTARRKTAMNKRKTLLQDKLIISGYVNVKNDRLA